MDKKLRDIIEYAYENSKFYKKLYNKNGIDDISKISSIEQLPIITEKDILTYPNEIKTSLDLYKVSASSGTKGNPKVMFRTYDDFECSVLNELCLLKWAGVKNGDRIAVFHSYGLWGYGELTQEAAKRLRVCVLPIGDIENSTALPLMKMFLPTVLDITPSRLLQIIPDLCDDDNILSNIKIIMCAGEYLSPNMKEYFEKRLDVKIYNQYGSEETDGLAGTMDDSNIFHLFQNSFYYEILNEKNGIGELAITSYYHHGTPLIRYNLKDYVKKLSDTEILLLGRTCEAYELFDGVILYPYQIEEILGKYSNIIESWSVIIERGLPIHINLMIKLYLNTNVDEERLIEDLNNTSIDIKLLVDSGDLIFKISANKVGFKLSSRGKSKKFIDMREKRTDYGSRKDLI